MGRYIPYNGAKLRRIVREEKEKGNEIVLTGGYFDYLHTGHAELFKKCKKLGDITIVNVINDKRAKIFRKGDRELDYREGTRVRLSTLITIIDYVIVYPQIVRDFNPTIGLARILKPDIIVQNEAVWAKYDVEELEEYLGYKPRLESIKADYFKVSSTEIRKRRKRISREELGDILEKTVEETLKKIMEEYAEREAVNNSC